MTTAAPPITPGKPDETITDDKGRLVLVDLDEQMAVLKGPLAKAASFSTKCWGVFGLILFAAGVWVLIRLATNPSVLFSTGTTTTPVWIGAATALMVSWSLVSRRRHARKPPRLPPFSAALLAIGRCGGCGYELRTIADDAEGFRVCPECGGCWHRDRAVWQHESIQKQRELLDRTIAGSTRTWNGGDDRCVPLEFPAQWPPATMRWTPPPSHPLIKRLNAQGWRRAKIMSAALIAAWVIGVSLWVWLSDPYMRPTSAVIVVTFIGLLALCAAATRWPLCAAYVRREILAEGNCPACWNFFVERQKQFDGCTICGVCRSAWKADEIGPFPPSK